jgi:hypothetical protein
VQLREVVRQEPLSGRAIRSGGKDWQNPSEIAFRVHADELTCGDHGIDHRGAPACGGVPDEKVVAKSYFSSSEAALDGILVYMHVTLSTGSRNAKDCKNHGKNTRLCSKQIRIICGMFSEVRHLRSYPSLFRNHPTSAMFC